jgi:hypothetical protein
MAVFWLVAICRLVNVYYHFRGLYYPHHQGALMMEAVKTSEISVNYQSTRSYNPEDNHLPAHSCENLTFYCSLAL